MLRTMREVITRRAGHRDHFPESVAASLPRLGLDRVEDQRIAFQDDVSLALTRRLV